LKKQKKRPRSEPGKNQGIAGGGGGKRVGKKARVFQAGPKKKTARGRMKGPR